MSTLDINFSIIVPHYNCPDLLVRCLRSIPKRSDLQVIVVDDCSPTPLQLAEFSNLPILEVYRTPQNEGPGGARNLGLTHAIGKWVIFADADDYFNYCFDSFLDQYKDSTYDIVYANANSMDCETYMNAGRLAFNRFIQSYIISEGKNEYLLRYEWGGPVCKLIQKTLIDKYTIQFDNYSIHEDTRFSYLIGYYAKSIAVEPRAIYCVTDRPGSLSKLGSKEKHVEAMHVMLKKYAFLASKGIEYPLINDSLAYTIDNIKDDAELQAKMFQIAEDNGIEKSLLELEIKKRLMMEQKNEKQQKRSRKYRKVKNICKRVLGVK